MQPYDVKTCKWRAVTIDTMRVPLSDASREVLSANLQLQTRWLLMLLSLHCLLPLRPLECCACLCNWQFALYG